MEAKCYNSSFLPHSPALAFWGWIITASLITSVDSEYPWHRLFVSMDEKVPLGSTKGKRHFVPRLPHCVQGHRFLWLPSQKILSLRQFAQALRTCYLLARNSKSFDLLTSCYTLRTINKTVRRPTELGVERDEQALVMWKKFESFSLRLSCNGEAHIGIATVIAIMVGGHQALWTWAWDSGLTGHSLPGIATIREVLRVVAMIPPVADFRL